MKPPPKWRRLELLAAAPQKPECGIRGDTIDDEPERNAGKESHDVERYAFRDRMLRSANVGEWDEALQQAVVPEENPSKVGVASRISRGRTC